MRPEIIKKIQEESEKRRRPEGVPLRVPVPETDISEEEDVSVVSNIIVIDL